MKNVPAPASTSALMATPTSNSMTVNPGWARLIFEGLNSILRNESGHAAAAGHAGRGPDHGHRYLAQRIAIGLGQRRGRDRDGAGVVNPDRRGICPDP